MPNVGEKVLETLTNNKLLAVLVAFALGVGATALTQSAETRVRVETALKAQDSSKAASDSQRRDIEELAKALIRLEERQKQDAISIAEIQKDVKELLRRAR